MLQVNSCLKIYLCNLVFGIYNLFYCIWLRGQKGLLFSEEKSLALLLESVFVLIFDETTDKLINLNQKDNQNNKSDRLK